MASSSNESTRARLTNGGPPGRYCHQMSLYTLDLQVPQNRAAALLQKLQAEREAGTFDVISSNVLYSDLNASYYRLEIFSARPAEDRVREILEPEGEDVVFQIREDLSLYDRPLVEMVPRSGLEFRRTFMMTSPEALATAQESLLPQRSQLAERRVTKIRLGLFSNGLALDKPHQATMQLERDAFLIARHGGVQAFPLWIETNNEEQFIRTVVSLAANFFCVRLSGLSRTDADDIVVRITEQVSVPVIHAERDETAVAMAAVVLNAAHRHDLQVDGLSVGIVGLGPDGLSLGELLLSFGFGKVFGIDGDPRQLTRFERGPGIATSLEHMYENADLVVVTPEYQTNIEQSRLRPEQIFLSFSPGAVIRSESAAPAARFYHGYAPHPVFVLPGLVAAAQQHGLKSIDLAVRRKLTETLRAHSGPKQLLPVPTAELIRNQISAMGA